MINLLDNPEALRTMKEGDKCLVGEEVMTLSETFLGYAGEHGVYLTADRRNAGYVDPDYGECGYEYIHVRQSDGEHQFAVMPVDEMIDRLKSGKYKID